MRGSRSVRVLVVPEGDERAWLKLDVGWVTRPEGVQEADVVGFLFIHGRIPDGWSLDFVYHDDPAG